MVFPVLLGSRRKKLEGRRKTLRILDNGIGSGLCALAFMCLIKNWRARSWGGN